ncbi:MAS20 protein import receptor [Plectosphaerella cucumerina]|uniref:Mitochondrial import receptor subunit TOM20 n=1 Tax=Plectosphaerella cucumerina TaxID=40658 RepID=A0A8K0T7T8_9PEZI|nr:MAS20 protein import receptor [Plectosphaerella cucumerina]
MVQNSTIITASVAAVATGILAYVVYFDYNRRADPNFRRKLRRNERQQHRAEKDAAVEESARQRQTIKALVAEAKDEGYPSDTEGREAFFLQQVSEGETLSVDPSRSLEAALAFYRALKVYPTPGDLINIYDKTVPKPVLDILAEMIAYDSDLKIGGSYTGGVNLSDMPPAAGLD